jgi:hypothetical protein
LLLSRACLYPPLQGGPAFLLPPPRPDALSPPPLRSLRRAHNTRRHEHPLAGGRFLEVRLVLLRRVCGLLFFLYFLEALDLLEGEAHYATVLALVLEVDGLLVVVDEDL